MQYIVGLFIPEQTRTHQGHEIPSRNNSNGIEMYLCLTRTVGIACRQALIDIARTYHFIPDMLASTYGSRVDSLIGSSIVCQPFGTAMSSTCIIRA
jgi:hypothetical protein